MTDTPPLPATNHPDSAPFWAAAREHRLVIQRCEACATVRFPPHPYCSRCRSPQVSWIDVSGKARIWTYAVVYKPVLPAYERLAPFPVAYVELDDHPKVRMTGNVVAAPGAPINSVSPDELYIGAPVQVVFEDVADDVSLPRWMPVEG
jgi:uncharacterized OB-fold protein